MRSVAVLTPSFFDQDGTQLFFGGGERYLLELGRLLQARGCQVAVFQPASRDWRREFRGLVCHGLGPARFQEDTWPHVNQRFQQAAAAFDLHIYFTIAMAYPQAKPGSLAISHSLCWDDGAYPWRGAPSWMQRLGKALQQPDLIVANDTNIINWVRATFGRLESKFEFIPNFVDISLFTPGPPRVAGRPFTVLFPRRLAPQKGLEETLVVAQRLLERDPQIQFRFVGRGLPADEARMQALAQRSPRVAYEWREPEQMAHVYQEADLVLIPSLAAEGTSLSCLEAMACGRPVIAGWVGGLSNLVIDGYNGRLIHVTPQTLEEAILHLQADAPTRKLFAERSREIAAVHGLTRWQERFHALFDRITQTGRR